MEEFKYEKPKKKPYYYIMFTVFQKISETIRCFVLKLFDMSTILSRILRPINYSIICTLNIGIHCIGLFRPQYQNKMLWNRLKILLVCCSYLSWSQQYYYHNKPFTVTPSLPLEQAKAVHKKPEPRIPAHASSSGKHWQCKMISPASGDLSLKELKGLLTVQVFHKNQASLSPQSGVEIWR